MMPNTRSESVQEKKGQQSGAAGNESRRLQPQRTRQAGALQRYGDEPFSSPFQLFRRLSEQMDEMFDRAFGGFSGTALSRRASPSFAAPQLWAPRIEAFQRGDEFVVRAELPGLKRDDVRVNVTDDSLVIEGERRDEFENTHGDVYHSERAYGSFYREIPLPEGTITDKAEASFKNGVLEVKLHAPPREVRRGRSVDVTEG
jgi:HSP20 family protein